MKAHGGGGGDDDSGDFVDCRKMRDPLNNVGFVLRKKLDRLKTNRSNPSLDAKLYNHVHPDLSVSSCCWENGCIKSQFNSSGYMKCELWQRHECMVK